MSRLILLAASMRRDSCNKKLIHQVYQRLTQGSEHDCHMPEFSDFIAPLYNGDIEDSEGIPVNVTNFIEDLRQATGLIIASPEYNYSVPAPLKNLIDWTSRAKPMPFARKPILLLSASPSFAGGSRGLLALEVTLLACGAYVFPRTFSLSNAWEAFDNVGRLKNEQAIDDLNKCVTAFIKQLNQDNKPS